MRVHPSNEACREGRLFILRFLGLSFGRTRIVIRAIVADHANSLDFNLNPGSGEVRHGDKCTAGIVSVLKIILAHFHELVAIPGFFDENRHAHNIIQAAAGAF